MEAAERHCEHLFVAYLHIISCRWDGETAGRAVGTLARRVARTETRRDSGLRQDALPRVHLFRVHF